MSQSICNENLEAEGAETYFKTEVDKFNNAHVTILKTGGGAYHIRKALSDALKKKEKREVLGVFFNIPFGIELTFLEIAVNVPKGFPMSPIRDTQAKMFRFIDAPPSVPTGGNVDVGATAIVYDPSAKKVLMITDARNGRAKYPGGRFDAISDTDFVCAARRECLEETGYKIEETVEAIMLGPQHFKNNQFAPGLNIVFLFCIAGASEQQKVHGDGVETSSADWCDVGIDKQSRALPSITLEMFEKADGLSLCQTKSSRRTNEVWYEFWGAPLEQQQL